MAENTEDQPHSNKTENNISKPNIYNGPISFGNVDAAGWREIATEIPKLKSDLLRCQMHVVHYK